MEAASANVPDPTQNAANKAKRLEQMREQRRKHQEAKKAKALDDAQKGAPALRDLNEFKKYNITFDESKYNHNSVENIKLVKDVNAALDNAKKKAGSSTAKKKAKPRPWWKIIEDYDKLGAPELTKKQQESAAAKAEAKVEAANAKALADELVAKKGGELFELDVQQGVIPIDEQEAHMEAARKRGNPGFLYPYRAGIPSEPKPESYTTRIKKKDNVVIQSHLEGKRAQDAPSWDVPPHIRAAVTKLDARKTWAQHALNLIKDPQQV